MITVEKWHTIRTLNAHGHSHRSIAKSLGVSRQTVKRAISQEALVEYQRPSGVFETLDKHRETVSGWLSSGKDGVRIFEDIRSLGYKGSQATFYRWLRSVRGAVADNSVYCRFETDAGDQSQFDWSPYSVPIGGELVNVVIFGLVLGYSRRVHWYPSVSENQESIMEALEECFWFHGGVCKRVIIDNAKTMVLMHRNREITWNQCFIALCGHYRTQPIAATVRHPETKGKVENPFRSLESRFIKSNSWQDWDHFVKELSAFETRWEDRVHSGIGTSPAERFTQECSALIALPPRRFLGCPNQLRHVQKDGLMSWRGVRYCVPQDVRIHQVRVKTRHGRELCIYDMSGKHLITHKMQPAGTPPVFAAECYQSNEKRRRCALATVTSKFKEMYSTISAVSEQYLLLIMEHHPNHPEEAIQRVLDLMMNVPLLIAGAVFGELVTANLADINALNAVLKKNMTGRDLSSPQVPSSRSEIPGLDIERPLSVYAFALDASSNKGNSK